MNVFSIRDDYECILFVKYNIFLCYMGYSRRRAKNSRRIKYAKSKRGKRSTSKPTRPTRRGKRSTSKPTRRLSRKRSFRTNKRVKRGGQNDYDFAYERAQQKHEEDQYEMDDIKNQKNMIEIEKNKKLGIYADPFNEWVEDAEYHNQSNDLEMAERQQQLEDDLDMEDDVNGPITFGGKKKKRMNRK